MSIRAIHRLISDESGQDLIEYAVISGVVAVGSLLFVIITAFLMQFNYTNWLTQAQDQWEPCPPGGCS